MSIAEDVLEVQGGSPVTDQYIGENAYVVSYICDDMDTHLWFVRLTPEQLERVERWMERREFTDPYVGSLRWIDSFEAFAEDIGLVEDEEDHETAVPAGG